MVTIFLFISMPFSEYQFKWINFVVDIYFSAECCKQFEAIVKTMCKFKVFWKAFVLGRLM